VAWTSWSASGAPVFELNRTSNPLPTKWASGAPLPPVATALLVCAGESKVDSCTFVFLLVILGATHKTGARRHRRRADCLSLTLIHLTVFLITNTSVKPARSTGVRSVGARPWGPVLWLFVAGPNRGGSALARLGLQGMFRSRNSLTLTTRPDTHPRALLVRKELRAATAAHTPRWCGPRWVQAPDSGVIKGCAAKLLPGPVVPPEIRVCPANRPLAVKH